MKITESLVGAVLGESKSESITEAMRALDKLEAARYREIREGCGLIRAYIDREGEALSGHTLDEAVDASIAHTAKYAAVADAKDMAAPTTKASTRDALLVDCSRLIMGRAARGNVEAADVLKRIICAIERGKQS